MLDRHGRVLGVVLYVDSRGSCSRQHRNRAHHSASSPTDTASYTTQRERHQQPDESMPAGPTQRPAVA